ncbi:MAG: hypothetical protein Q9218_004487, partial [Villophora microphyllina]
MAQRRLEAVSGFPDSLTAKIYHILGDTDSEHPEETCCDGPTTLNLAHEVHVVYEIYGTVRNMVNKSIRSAIRGTMSKSTTTPTATALYDYSEEPGSIVKILERIRKGMVPVLYESARKAVMAVGLPRGQTLQFREEPWLDEALVFLGDKAKDFPLRNPAGRPMGLSIHQSSLWLYG